MRSNSLLGRYAVQADQRYLAEVLALAQHAADATTAEREAAAQIVAESFARGGLLHAFGTGHSHMLALELFYRAGGFAAVDPILVEALMLHESATTSTLLERDPDLLDGIVSRADFGPHDALLVVSNSGGNPLVVGLAQRARETGIPVIALTSLRHATSSIARQQGLRVHDIADVVVDNFGVEGDAILDIDGARVGPSSTVLGALLLNAVMARVAEILSERGLPLEVFTSANVAQGDERNAVLVAKYADRIAAL